MQPEFKKWVAAAISSLQTSRLVVEPHSTLWWLREAKRQIAGAEKALASRERGAGVSPAIERKS